MSIRLRLLSILLLLHAGLNSASSLATMGLQRLNTVSSSVLAAVSQKAGQFKQSVNNRLHAMRNDVVQGCGDVQYKLLIPPNSWDPSCMIGECQFSDIKPPEGMTREEWYKRMLLEQQKYLRANALKDLGFFQEAFEENKFKIIDHQNKIEESLAKKLKQDRQYEDWFKKRGYFCKVISAKTKQKNILATAKNNLIVLRPSFYSKFLRKVDKEMCLYHEVSHLDHNDFIFNIYINSSNHKVCNVINEIDEVSENYSVNSDRNAHTIKNLYKKGDIYKEYRADMEALFNLKKEESFQNYVKNKKQYQGYPFVFNPRCGYCNQAQVNYLGDFLRGIENDYVNQLSEKEKNQYLQYKKFYFVKNKLNLLNFFKFVMFAESLVVGCLCKKCNDIGVFDTIKRKYKKYLRTLKFPDENYEVLT